MEGALSWEGDEAFLLSLPGMVWDEVLLNIGSDKKAVQDSVFIERLARAKSDPEALFMGLVELVDQPDPEWTPDYSAVVNAFLNYPYERQWTETDATTRNDTQLLMAVLSVCWDSPLRLLFRAGGAAALEPVLVNLQYQLDYYRSEGMPAELNDLGRAPFFAAASGSRDRLKTEVAEFAGLSVAEWELLPRDEQDVILERHAAATLPDHLRP